jgi:uncharacterized protein YjdB
VSWTSSKPAVAKISRAGLATALAQGTTTLSAKLDGMTASTTLTVTPAVLRSITLTPANPTIAKGKTEQFIATGTFSDHTMKRLTSQVDWASSKKSVATIGASGLARALAKGSVTITAKLGAVMATTKLTVSNQ